MTYGTPAVQSLHAGAGASGDKFDIVILAEGFRSTEMALFSTNAAAVRDALLGMAPYDSYSKFIRVWQVNTISTDSGADRPVWNQLRNTCFDSSYVMVTGDVAGPGRLLTVNNNANIAAARDRVAGADLVIIIINDSYYGGAGGGGVCTTYNGDQMLEVVTHETGHAATNLGDEYVYAMNAYRGGERSEPNLTIMSYAPWAKWSEWNGTEAEDGGTVGTFAGGAMDFSSGIYRPVNEGCHMRNLRYGFCPVCREAVIRMMHSKTNPITAAWSSSQYLWFFGTVNFGSFTACLDEIVPDDSTYVVWNVDGEWVGSSYSYGAGTAQRHVLDRALTPGYHTVTGWVVDTTSMLAIGGWYARPMRSVSFGFFQF